ncbi:hypothetical protein Aau02nite_29320 [Amorphoplanes auranticolor]|uniref:DUF305 domain-containing protein n=2 Tax=Actinoplanes auranticolor TaxID=47988 RepID=A0A919SA38_9ACTN|nr:hypothetical protein Aau02nite_29320 [Actinoplanes auranticolor]
MIAHHIGVITMTRSALRDGGNAHVQTPAAHIINEQAAENDALPAPPATPPPG